MTRCGKAALSLGTVFVAAVAMLFLFAGRWLSAPAQPAVQADLIVALGGDSGARVLTAARLYRENWAPRVLMTGIEGGDARARDVLLELRARLLVAQGVPPEALLFEQTAGNSREEAAAVHALMARERRQRVLAVSDLPCL
ncbi:MAG TPA: YdcF family protein [Nevskiales bacterium]|nr:YdcF family protein [Nevskiales bacterium]